MTPLLCPRGCGRPSRRVLTRNFMAAGRAPLCRECILTQAGRLRAPEAAKRENARRATAKAAEVERRYLAALAAIRTRRWAV
jgi:hypothetical protein